MPSWSGFFGDTATTTGSHSLLSRNSNRLNALRARVRRVLVKDGMRAERELLDTTIGASAGSAASANHPRVEAPTDGSNLGGSRTIETVTDISRNSAAGDVTDLKDDYATPKTSAGYVGDLSGNPR